MENNQLLIIGFVWPEPESSAAGSRMIQLITLFQEMGWGVTFASTASESAYTFDLASIGVTKQSIQLNSDSFDGLLLDINPRVVLFDRFNTEEQFGWRVTLHCPYAIRILDTEDLHCLRIVRGKRIKEQRRFVLEDLLSEDITKREIASIFRCDLTLMIAEFEMELLQSFFKIDSSLLFYLPYLIVSSDEKHPLSAYKYEDRRDFIFIGNFLHEPNWDATLYLKNTIWPLIRSKMPKAILRIYGAYPSQKVFQLHNENEGFLILGRADSVQQIMSEAKILLAPLRFGAGIKGKLIEAMQYGIPSITTQIGAESINGTLKWNGTITDDESDVADAAVTLYNNEEIWNQSIQNGQQILQKRFLKVDFETIFKDKISTLDSELEQHRKRNFIGSLLQHHTMKSTEYMSRWIQEKNK